MRHRFGIVVLVLGILAFFGAITLAWNSSDYWILRGDYRGRLQEWSEAMACYEQARQRDPSSWRAQARAALAYGKLGRHDDEDGAYRSALALCETDEVLLPWAESCLARGRRELAHSLLRLAIRDGCHPLECSFMMGRLYLGLGQNDKARFWFAKALEINPHCSFASAGLAFLAQQEGDLSVAAFYFENAATAAPDINQEVLLNAAVCYSKTGRPQAALRCLERAAAMTAGGRWVPALLLQARILKVEDPSGYRRVVAQLGGTPLTSEQARELQDLTR